MNLPLEEARSAENTRLQAMVAKDIPTLLNLLDDELIYVHSTGRSLTKTDYISHVEDKGFAYLSIESSPDKSIIRNGTAILVERVSASMRLPSREDPVHAKLAVLTVWRSSSTGWKLLSSISSPVKESGN